MNRSEPMQCPTCGWTGERGDLDRDGENVICPACGEAIDVV